MVSLKKSSLKNHVNGKMHQNKLATFNQGKKNSHLMLEYVQDIEGMNTNKSNELLYRMQICEMLLMEGIPFKKLLSRNSGGLRDMQILCWKMDIILYLSAKFEI